MKSRLIFLFALALIVTLQNCKKDEAFTIINPGPNALSAAIANATEGTTLWLKPGVYTESEGIIIDKNISLKGEDGAIIQVATTPTNSDKLSIDAAIYIVDIGGVCLENLQIEPLGQHGGTAVFFENSPSSIIQYCKITGHQYAIVVQKCDRLLINANVITGGLLSGIYDYGVIWINGKNGKISHNIISGCVFGIWPCDEDGVITGNNISRCAYGTIPCKVVRQNKFVTPRTPVPDTIAASITASGWQIINNEFHQNQWGLALADGANSCIVRGNSFHDNTIIWNADILGPYAYDIELVGESYRFGDSLFTSSSSNNLIEVRLDQVSTIRIKDCSLNKDNTILPRTVTLVDTVVEPCK